MKQKIALSIFAAFVTILLCSYATGYGSSTGGGNLTGAKGTSGCSCHSSTSSIGTTVELDSAGVLVTTYHPGVSYSVKISATNNTSATNLSHFGFQLSVVDSVHAGTANAVQAGTWGSTLPTDVQNTTSGTIPVIEHNTPIPATTGTGGAGTTYVESIPWTAPAAGTGTIKIYGVLNAVNYDGTDQGDDNQAATPVSIREASSSLVASVSIAQTAGTNPVCAGTSVTFTATPTNGGTAPTYQWKVNGTNTSTGATFTSASLAAGTDTVKCIMTSNLSGVTGSPATSNLIILTVNPTVVPSVTISTPTTTVCAGASVTFTATPTNGGTPSYQWKVGTTNVGTNSASYTTTSLTNGQVVSCVMTSTATCASPASVTSNTITMTVNPSVVPSVTISTPATTICAGTGATFTPTPVHGGSPTYQWFADGTASGTGATYTSSALTNGEQVYCVMTSTASCAVPSTVPSDTITMTVNPTVTPSVTISTPTTSVCPGSSVTFTATPTNGGTAPTYQWKVNGTVVATGATYTTSGLTNNAIVTCVMTSNAPCTSSPTATSNSLTMSVASQTPAITITASANPTCSGVPDTFTAHITNGGLSPSFQWKVNGTDTGTNSSTFVSATLANHASVTCVLTSSLSCASPTTATSVAVVVTVDPSVIPGITISIAHDTLCPGASATFSSSGANLGSAPVYQWSVNGTNEGTDTSVFSSSSLPNGAVVKCIVASNAVCASPQGATSNGVTMDILPAPPIAITPSGAVVVCAYDSLLLTASGGISYHWSNNDTTASIWVKQAGTYDVTGTNGTCAAIAPPAIASIDTPSVPTISHHNNVLTSTPAVGYEWVLNDTLLSADTLQTLTIAESGNYSVITRDASGCYAHSIDYLFSYIDGLANIGNDIGLRVYPIPNQGSFIIDYDHSTNALMSVYDIYGRMIYEQALTSGHTQIIGLNLAPAIYFVRVSDGNEAQTIRMEVVKE